MAIPTVDLSPFFTEGADDEQKKAIEIIKEACSQYGFFQIVNHGVPLDLMCRAIQLCKTFFASPDEEKLKFSPGSGAPLPAGYTKPPSHSSDKKEYLLMFQPQLEFNKFPENPPDFRDVQEEMFAYFRKAGELIENILNGCLGLPPGFLKQYNHDRSWDFMISLHYFPATDNENCGIGEHEDGNIISFVIQDDVGGLEVKQAGEWIPVTPAPGTIIVNIGDCVQVWSNKKFKSATHRVVRSKERHRHSLAFFYTIKGDKLIEPLPQFTEEIGDAPKYRGFLYKEYQALRLRNKTHPPSRPEDIISITHYEISTK